MEIQHQLRGLNPRTVTDRPLDQQLERLNQLLPISSASVMLEHQHNATPAFCVSVDLAVPGPDIHAAARGHTLEAAMLKVVGRPQHQINARIKRQAHVNDLDRCGKVGRVKSFVGRPSFWAGAEDVKRKAERRPARETGSVERRFH